MKNSQNREILLEVCVDSLESALAAEEGGAARIELCSALSEGGLTPTVGTLKTLKSLPLQIPIFCMLRPRSGTDFILSEQEFLAILTDLELLRDNGADGFVFGALTKERKIDFEKCAIIKEYARDLPCTFHRAFDVTNPKDVEENIDQLSAIGFQRILTSGFKKAVGESVDLLAKLISEYNSRIIIMPGAGISVSNLEDILTTTRCLEFHSSAKRTAGNDFDVSTANIVKMDYVDGDTAAGGREDTELYQGTDVHVVRQMVVIAKLVNSSP